MPRVVIASAVRTPFTRALKGEFKDTRPDTLAADAIREAVAQVPGLKPADVQDVILGCAMPEAEQGMNVARQAALLAGLPDSVPAMTINRFCSSGVQSIAQAAQSIVAGMYDVAVAGGTESMSMVPMGGNKPSANPELMETLPQIYTSMGATAENRPPSRCPADQTPSPPSQRRAAERGARASSRTRSSREDRGVRRAGNGQEVTVTEDTILPPTHAGGTGQTGLQSQGNGDGWRASLTDGAGAAVVMSGRGPSPGVKPLGYFIDFQVAGVPPEIMGIGPVPAVRKLLAKNKLEVKDIDVFELNEAFAAQALYCIRELGIDRAKVNPNGGAIALGHPLGVSGTHDRDLLRG
jgi:acetyl-CoA acyltransferase